MSAGKKVEWGRIIFAGIFLLAIGAVAVAWKMIYKPTAKAALVRKTSASDKCTRTYKVALDSFSGYFVFRSDTFHRALEREGICLDLVDDKANYAERFEGLKDGEYQLALFELTAFVKQGALAKEFPATAVVVVDETRDADGVVAFKDVVPDIDALNRPDARFVTTLDSPSEFLSRVIYYQFNLDRIEGDWMEGKDGSAKVLAEMKADVGSGKPRAYALWEPFLSRALALPNAHLLMGSSKVPGRIVDLLVAPREFLADKPDDVRLIVEAYLRTLYSFQSDEQALLAELIADAKRTKSPALSMDEAKRLVSGLLWKNTQDNYATFGLQTVEGTITLEKSIDLVTRVHEGTNSIPTASMQGLEKTVFNPAVLAEMQRAGFHPRVRRQLVEGMGGGKLANAHTMAKAKKLTPEMWQKLQKVGSLKVPDIPFLRGSAELSPRGRRILDDLARDMSSWPHYYVLITGRARAAGDAAANQRLMQERAQAAATHLKDRGVSAARLRVETAKKSKDASGAAQAVSFTVLQETY